MNRVIKCPSCGKWFVFRSTLMPAKTYLIFYIGEAYNVSYRMFGRKLSVSVLWNWSKVIDEGANPVEESDKALRRLVALAHELRKHLNAAYLASVEYWEAKDLAYQMFLKLWTQTEPANTLQDLPPNVSLQVATRLYVGVDTTVPIVFEYEHGSFTGTTTNNVVNVLCLAAALPEYKVQKDEERVVLKTRFHLFGKMRSVEVKVARSTWSYVEALCYKNLHADPLYAAVVQKIEERKAGRVLQ